MVKKKVVKRKLNISKRKAITQPSQGPLPISMTKEQAMLNGMLGGGERTWGTGKFLPRRNGILISGGGLIKSGDRERETARSFGLR